jgi:pimeloyl-ACP methyl ester carboxylesterase
MSVLRRGDGWGGAVGNMTTDPEIKTDFRAMGLHRLIVKTILAAVKVSALVLMLFQIPAIVQAAELKPLSITMEEYDYPYQVHFLPLTIEGQDLKMAYMDVLPTGEGNGRAVLLLHGKNFFGTYWKDTIKVLTQNGYRVIVPDQIGFGKSSKPNIHYSFHLLAANTKKLLDFLGLKEVAVVGHSMGGMLATRFVLMYPAVGTQLVLENPIGLEDYRLITPYAPLDDLYRNELNAGESAIRNYHKTYYVQWKPEYDEYVIVAARWKGSGEFPRLAMSSALTYQMIYEQPVCHEFSNIKAKTLLIIGQSDRTVVGKARVRKELLEKVGQYPALGRRAAGLIPNSVLVEIPNVGHIPHFEAKDKFHQELLYFLKK